MKNVLEERIVTGLQQSQTNIGKHMVHFQQREILSMNVNIFGTIKTMIIAAGIVALSTTSIAQEGVNFDELYKTAL